MARPGVLFGPLEQRLELVLELAELADSLGYASVNVGEAWGRDGFLLLARIAERTRQARLGLVVVSAWTRTPATLAMATATLQEQSGGRVVLGLGASSRALAEGFHDLPYERPLTRLRTTVEQVRALLEGERVPLAATQARPLRLGMPPAPGTPIYLGALAPRALRLTGELADGWYPYLAPAGTLGRLQASIDEGRRARSATLPQRIAVSPSIPALVSPDGVEARERVAAMLATYLVTMGEFYAPFVAGLGYADEIAALREANPRGSEPTLPAAAEPLLADEGIYGDPAAARSALARWVAAGADEPILVFPPGAPAELMRLTIEALAPGQTPAT